MQVQTMNVENVQTWLDLMMLKNAARGRLTLPGDLDTPHAWAYLPDLAETFARVAWVRDRLPAFATLHFQGHTVTGHDWVSALDPQHRLRVTHVPWPLLRAFAFASRLGSVALPLLGLGLAERLAIIRSALLVARPRFMQRHCNGLLAALDLGTVPVDPQLAMLELVHDPRHRFLLRLALPCSHRRPISSTASPARGAVHVAIRPHFLCSQRRF